MQLNIFELTKPKYKITKPIRLIELFAGIGSQAKALKNIGANFEHHRVVEFDKYAIASYNAIHGTNFETSDITKITAKDLNVVDTNKYEYIMTYSFPCQDLSLAGKQGGMTKGDKTRSGLLWEVERLLDKCSELPQILLMENVPQVIGQKNFADFREWEIKLEQLGYSNYFELLNAKDYGIPQNRKRCFMISVLGDYYYEFPKKKKLKLRLRDFLEDEVDEKYYLSGQMIDYIVAGNEKWTGNNNKSIVNKSVASTINTGEGSRRCDASNYILTDIDKDDIDLKNIEVFDFRYDEGIRGRVDSECSPTLTTKVGSSGISGEPLLKIREATKKGHSEAQEGDGVYINRPHQKRGVVQKGMIQTIKTQSGDIGVVVAGNTKNLKERMCNNLIEQGKVKEYDVIRHSYTKSRMKGEMKDIQENNISPTLDTRADCLGVVVKGNYSPSGHNASRIVDKEGLAPTVMENHGTVTAIEQKLRIRKLTPRECWRLMGFSDEDFDKAAKVNSNSQLYKQAGNSIVVNVLVEIFKMLF